MGDEGDLGVRLPGGDEVLHFGLVAVVEGLVSPHRALAVGVVGASSGLATSSGGTGDGGYVDLGLDEVASKESGKGESDTGGETTGVGDVGFWGFGCDVREGAGE